MARIYEYAVLTAVPNRRRGERVNVGVVVFRSDRIDVRFKQAGYKLRALTGENWDARLESAEAHLTALASAELKPSDVLAEFVLLEPLLVPSDLGWLKAADDFEYERAVDQIIGSLIGVPRRRERVETKTRINTEIAQEFRRINVLGKDIESGMVVRDFEIDDDEGLRADFALQNGKLHVASTLDLRKQNTNLGEAALKSIVLDKAGRKYDKNVRKIGVYAVDEDLKDSFRSHMSLLGDYADELYNWGDFEGRSRFRKSILDAIGVAGHGLL